MKIAPFLADSLKHTTGGLIATALVALCTFIATALYPTTVGNAEIKPAPVSLQCPPQPPAPRHHPKVKLPRH
jgi:hypothetical protein